MKDRAVTDLLGDGVISGLSIEARRVIAREGKAIVIPCPDDLALHTRPISLCTRAGAPQAPGAGHPPGLASSAQSAADGRSPLRTGAADPDDLTTRKGPG